MLRILMLRQSIAADAATVPFTIPLWRPLKSLYIMAVVSAAVTYA